MKIVYNQPRTIRLSDEEWIKVQEYVKTLRNTKIEETKPIEETVDKPKLSPFHVY